MRCATSNDCQYSSGTNEVWFNTALTTRNTTSVATSFHEISTDADSIFLFFHVDSIALIKTTQEISRAILLHANIQTPASSHGRLVFLLDELIHFSFALSYRILVSNLTVHKSVCACAYAGLGAPPTLTTIASRAAEIYGSATAGHDSTYEIEDTSNAADCCRNSRHNQWSVHIQTNVQPITSSSGY